MLEGFNRTVDINHKKRGEIGGSAWVHTRQVGVLLLNNKYIAFQLGGFSRVNSDRFHCQFSFETGKLVVYFGVQLFLNRTFQRALSCISILLVKKKTKQFNKQVKKSPQNFKNQHIYQVKLYGRSRIDLWVHNPKSKLPYVWYDVSYFVQLVIRVSRTYINPFRSFGFYWRHRKFSWNLYDDYEIVFRQDSVAIKLKSKNILVLNSTEI